MEDSIRSDDEKGELDAMILREARLVINLGYVPDWSPQEFADVLDAFRVALRDLPRWAVGHAFFEWRRTRPRRPSPAEIRILAQRAMQPITDELARRRKVVEQAETIGSRRNAVSKEKADQIMATAGYNPHRTDLVRKFPTARTVTEAAAKAEAPDVRRHWTETADQAQLEALRAARDANPNVQAARRAMAEGQLDGDSSGSA